MASGSARQPSIENALHAIADGAPLPWNELDPADADPARIEALRTLHAIASAFRAQAPAAAGTERGVLFHWGGLEIERLLGEGGFGEVYRAFDPWLGRYVALKLFRGFDNAGGLDEARRLARLRHHNVLSVYGCGVHDGRAGLWSELIEGRTLADSIAAEGALSETEAVRVGRDLAQALAIVHGAGLVHGDIKAENVMRESGGRIVLMDFGAGGEARLLAGARLISGTPRYFPPEVLDGTPLGASSDIYAFGVLMFLLLSARLPYTATDAPALREAQRHANRPALRSLRPDLDPALCELIEHCLDSASARRPANAYALRDAFGGLTHKASPAERLPRAKWMAFAGALLAAGFVLWWVRGDLRWDSNVQILRVEPSGDVALAPDASLRVGDRLRLAASSSRDAYLYVLNEDAAGNATVLFPLADAPHKPQPGGSALLLPGDNGDPALAWVVTADSAREEFIVIAALTPVPELEHEIAGWNHARAGDQRAVGRVVRAPAPQVQGGHLRRILAGLEHGPADVRVWQFRFAHQG
jgi:serine/threonine protein kinase